MHCLLPLIAGVCLADPSTTTIRLDALSQVAGPNFFYLDDHRYSGLVGRAELSLSSAEVRGVTVTYFLGHESYLNTNRDRGYEYVGMALVWRPFGGAR